MKNGQISNRYTSLEAHLQELNSKKQDSDHVNKKLWKILLLPYLLNRFQSIWCSCHELQP